MPLRFAAAVVLSGWLAIAVPTPSSAQTRSLEDLLLEAEADAEKQPVATKSVVSPDQVARDMRRLIDEREAIVNRSAFFDTLREIRREEPNYYVKCLAVKAAIPVAKRAQNQLNIVKGLAMGSGNGGPGPGAEQVANAERNYASASSNLARAQNDAITFYNAQLLPRYKRVAPELPRFFENYGRMRALLTLDRNDPARDHLFNELERGIQRNHDFVEGHVLAGIMHAYAGNEQRAEAAFAKASEINEGAGLAFSHLGYDCCYGLLLIGKPSVVDNYIKTLKSREPKWQTSVVCWLIGAHAFAKGKYNDSVRFLNKAIAKADESASPELRAEAAMPYLFAENTRSLEKAQKLLAGLEAASAWQVKRANAGVAAEQGQFPEAVALMEGCRASAPPHFDAELTAQQDAYKQGEVWRRNETDP